MSEYTDGAVAAFYKHEELFSSWFEVAGYKYSTGIFPEYSRHEWRFNYLYFQVLTL